jgi:transketolase
MEHPQALAEGGGLYRWHAGAPDDDAFARAHAELLERIGPVELVPVPPLPEERVSLEGEPESGIAARRTVTDEYVAAAYGEALLELAARVPELVVLDADLASDCRVRLFEDAHPDRFLENGIAEQDMVSAAAGMARHGLLPVVNSFASFLASRANEQIYNQASERTKVVYALHYAGLIPAGPGKSHQSVRDASLLAALPDVTVVHPASADETRALTTWAVEQAPGTVAIRLAIGPSPRRLELGDGVQVGRGTTLRDGTDALVVSYGPVMLHEALVAAERADASLQVVAMPWLNRVDRDWLAEMVESFSDVFVVEDHAPVGALGDALLRELAAASLLDDRTLHVYGVEGWPACGTPPEALRAHRLDGASLAERIETALHAPAMP